MKWDITQTVAIESIIKEYSDYFLHINLATWKKCSIFQNYQLPIPMFRLFREFDAKMLDDRDNLTRAMSL